MCKGRQPVLHAPVLRRQMEKKVEMGRMVEMGMLRKQKRVRIF